jgi:peroxiredoxin
MKTNLITFIIALNLLSSSCKKSHAIVVPPETILKGMPTLMDYTVHHLRLHGKFIAYDTLNNEISRSDFLQQLTTGNYLPLQLYSNGNNLEYQLYKLKPDVDSDIKRMIQQIGYTYYGIYQNEGKPLPKFHFVDLYGNIYTPENTKGKILVLKAWYIGCAPCAEEMPLLNKLTEKYKNRKDIIFVSIALNKKTALETFLKDHPFKYAVATTNNKYLSDSLKVVGYPAHWVINKQGIVVSMSYAHDEMIRSLQIEAAK